jgi:hypothetical protein
MVGHSRLQSIATEGGKQERTGAGFLQLCHMHCCCFYAMIGCAILADVTCGPGDQGATPLRRPWIQWVIGSMVSIQPMWISKDKMNGEHVHHVLGTVGDLAPHQ